MRLCGYRGLNTNVTFSDVVDPRAITAATALAAGQQTLTIAAGASTHVVGTTITQTVADCLGTNLGSPGTVGSGGSTQHLVFTTQPGGGAAGVVWAQQPVVVVENALNVVVTGDSSTVVTLSIGTNPAGGTLSCTSGSSRTVVNGVATFFGCSINAGSTSAYTLSATSNPAWSPATSNGFLVGSTQHLVFTTQPGGGAAGAVWAQQPVVAVENSLSQVVTGDNSTVVFLSIGSNPAGGTLSCTSGLSRTVVNGIAAFFGCSISIGSTSAYTLSATSSPAWSPATSAAFLISPSGLPVVITDRIAAGVNRGTTRFGTSSVVVPRGGWITLLGTTSPNLAGSVVQVWTRTKTGAWHVLTSRLAATDGTIHYFAHVNGWTAYQLSSPATAPTPRRRVTGGSRPPVPSGWCAGVNGSAVLGGFFRLVPLGGPVGFLPPPALFFLFGGDLPPLLRPALLFLFPCRWGVGVLWWGDPGPSARLGCFFCVPSLPRGYFGCRSGPALPPHFLCASLPPSPRVNSPPPYFPGVIFLIFPSFFFVGRALLVGGGWCLVPKVEFLCWFFFCCSFVFFVWGVGAGGGPGPAPSFRAPSVVAGGGVFGLVVVGGGGVGGAGGGGEGGLGGGEVFWGFFFFFFFFFGFVAA